MSWGWQPGNPPGLTSLLPPTSYPRCLSQPVLPVPSVPEAVGRWNIDLHNPAVGQDAKGPDGSPRLLVPIEDFVLFMHEGRVESTLEAGDTQRKNPKDIGPKRLHSAPPPTAHRPISASRPRRTWSVRRRPKRLSA